jgi:hypothetical protein
LGAHNHFVLVGVCGTANIHPGSAAPAPDNTFRVLLDKSDPEDDSGAALAVPVPDTRARIGQSDGKESVYPLGAELVVAVGHYVGPDTLVVGQCFGCVAIDYYNHVPVVLCAANVDYTFLLCFHSEIWKEPSPCSSST